MFMSLTFDYCIFELFYIVRAIAWRFVPSQLAVRPCHPRSR